jgi:hypothetical protein
MNAFHLLQTLEARGVVLTARGGKLIVYAPRSTLTAVDRDLLQRLKSGLLAVLEGKPTPRDLPEDWHQIWDERAAIMEFDGGLGRAQAEALALTDVLQSMERTGVFFRCVLDRMASRQVECSS